MSLVLFFAAWVNAQVPDLGHDSFEVREAATARLDWFGAALFVPRSSDDPEANYRLQLLRRRNLKWVSAEWWERLVYRDDYALWLDRYFCPGRHGISEADAFAGLDEWRRWKLLRLRWAHTPSEGAAVGWYYPRDLDEFRTFCDFHRLRIPPPREVRP